MSHHKTDPSGAIFDLKQFGEFGDVNPSITDSSTYTFLAAQTMLDTFHGEAEGCFLYSRHWNPSNKYLSDALAAMEGTPSAWVTASGMAAITTVLLQLCNAGDHIITSVTTYGGTFAFLQNYLPKFNIEVSFVNISDLESVQKAIRPNTRLIYTETLTNPLLQVSDIPRLSAIARKHQIKLIVDNTFSPLIISPSRLGADITVYSLTKFVNGKNDCVAGAICSDAAFIDAISNVNDGTAMLLGPVLDPLRSSGILKNLQHRGVGYLAVSLGYFKTLFSNPGKSTSSEVPEDIQREMGLSEGLVRFSVGLDHDIDRIYCRIKECL